MNAIYLEIEDDITTIISKLKTADSETAALVIPKRSNVFQSVVNLKLIKKSAEEAGKQVVLITKDSALLTLAGRLGLLTAPNLQAPAVVPGIDETQADLPSEIIEEEEATEPSLSEELPPLKTAIATPKPLASKAAKPLNPAKKKFKIPDFNSFKKRAILIGLGIAVLLGLFWVATRILPQATVVIYARTTSLDTNFEFTLDSSAEEVNREAAVVPAVTKEVSKTLTNTFEATQKKDAGTKASGEITVSNCYYSQPRTLPAGTIFTASNGKRFASTESVTVPGAVFAGGCLEAGQADVPVQAAQNGDSYNLAPTPYSIEGEPNLEADGTQMSGGTTKTVLVISQADVDKARRETLAKEQEATKKELLTRFSTDERPVESTFTEEILEAVAEPAVGSEANQGRVIMRVNYFMLGVTQENLKAITEYSQSKQLESAETDQKTIIDNGLEKADVKLVKTLAPNKRILQLRTEAVVGPNLKFEELSRQIAGKGYNETIEQLKGLPNVDRVEVKLSPFWVFNLPRNPAKINFEVQQP